jgi:hypothetical protein
MPANTYSKRANAKPGRVDLIPENFDNLVEDQGCRARITPSVVCPRRSGDFTEVGDSNHDLNCPLCFGSLIVDLDALAIEDWVFIQGMKIDKNFDPNSRFDIKDAFMSVRHSVRIGYWFKVEVIDFGTLFNQVVLRGVGNTDTLRYPTKDPFDGSFFAVVDHDGTTFAKDTDYTVTGRTLTWLTGNRPNAEKLYSIIYPVIPTYRVLELVHDNRFYYTGFKSPVKTPVQLPQQAHIRWDYLVSKGGSDVQAQ